MKDKRSRRGGLPRARPGTMVQPMSIATRRRAWVALYALVLQLLLPLAIPAQAVTGQPGADMVICTPDGLKAAGADGTVPAGDHPTFSCLRCDGILHVPVIPPAPTALPARLVPTEAVSFVWASDMAPRVAVATIRARAPPGQS